MSDIETIDYVSDISDAETIQYAEPYKNTFTKKDELFHLKKRKAIYIINFLNRLYVPKQVYLTAPKKELLIILPFLGTMSSNLKRKLQTSIRNSLPQCNIKVILKSTKRLSALFRFKDVILKS